DATASVTDTYTYDAFGIVISRTGTTANDYLYTGEQFDANLGFYYLRARYMNPAVGRFWIADSYEGDLTAPRSLHKYVYASGNPVDLIDPSGYMSIQEMAQVSAIVGILAAGTALIYGQLNYRQTNRMLRGNIVHKYIYPF